MIGRAGEARIIVAGRDEARCLRRSGKEHVSSGRGTGCDRLGCDHGGEGGRLCPRFHGGEEIFSVITGFAWILLCV